MDIAWKHYKCGILGLTLWQVNESESSLSRPLSDGHVKFGKHFELWGEKSKFLDSTGEQLKVIEW